MTFINLLGRIALVGLVVCVSAARGETTREAVARGKSLVAEGDLRGALEAYGTAGELAIPELLDGVDIKREMDSNRVREEDGYQQTTFCMDDTSGY